MNGKAKRLFGRIRNDLRQLWHSRADRAQGKLLADLAKKLALLEAEILGEFGN